MSKRTPVPAFHVLPRVVFTCLRCGATVEILQWGIAHVSSSDYCHKCKAYYIADFHQETEQSTIVLVEDEESEATA
jgi:hypothetical protein